MTTGSSWKLETAILHSCLLNLKDETVLSTSVSFENDDDFLSVKTVPNSSFLFEGLALTIIWLPAGIDTVSVALNGIDSSDSKFFSSIFNAKFYAVGFVF